MKLTKKEYIDLSKQFSLGHLTTEAFHPKTKSLSTLVKKDLRSAITTLLEVDHDALMTLKSHYKSLYEMQQTCRRVLNNNHKIFITGCGATGRLALSLEKIFREMYKTDQVVGIMAGGDYAIIRAVESFEDSREYGVRQLKELGVGENDLVIAITEGGETSFVIGTAEYGSVVCKEAPYFLFCNPNEELEHIKRSYNLITDERVKKINLTCGPMAISGSTRMQATSVQMLAAGFALLYEDKDYASFEKRIESFISRIESFSLTPLENFIKAEAEIYKNNENIIYEAGPHLAIAVLTDTTERSPTFSLNGFEKTEESKMSLSYLIVKDEENLKLGWEKILGHTPRCLSWENLDRKIDLEEIYKFDVSNKSITRRESLGTQHIFSITRLENELLQFRLGKLFWDLKTKDCDLFGLHFLLKRVLNIHSTLIMGLLERYDGNMMTYVRPSNLKLIDRSLRYIEEILNREQIQKPRDEILDVFFSELLEEDGASSPIVYRVLNKLR